MIFYQPEVRFVCHPLLISVKNIDKFVFLLFFYISFLLKHKKLKTQEKKKDLKARFENFTSNGQYMHGCCWMEGSPGQRRHEEYDPK